MNYTRTAIGLLTRQYRSVLKKCWLINVGLYALMAPVAATATAALTAEPAQAEEIGRQVIASGETVDEIEGSFTGHSNTNVAGGFVYNQGTVGIIDAVVANNTHNLSNPNLLPGLIYNYGADAQIGNIRGTYANNTVNTTVGDGSDDGIVVSNRNGTIDVIDARFINNTTSSTTVANASPVGVIFNAYSGARINHIYGYGGAAYSTGVLTFTDSNFTDNAASTAGGAIWIAAGSQITNLQSNFYSNRAQSTTSGAYGGAIYNHTSTITALTGDFYSNIAQSTDSSATGVR